MTQKKVKIENVPRGTVQEDSDGKWVILGTYFQNGKQNFHRVRFGSLAHTIAFPEHFK